MYEARYCGIVSAYTILHLQAGFIHVSCLGISKKSVAVPRQDSISLLHTYIMAYCRQFLSLPEPWGLAYQNRFFSSAIPPFPLRKVLLHYGPLYVGRARSKWAWLTGVHHLEYNKNTHQLELCSKTGKLSLRSPK